ncbi:arabinose phosphate phosphatase [Kaistia sp. 32K]|uniref:inositol monophosphatase family protein n=1 Tax=Kaistia sp. 32K TaxID=2795690 RepID=UPI001915026F|nr:inositol monophosphatase family protein [Kaistia sp. 32K]BCP55558.1 arabinose phosphate phosphatase [Kaistia sp. 32K]
MTEDAARATQARIEAIARGAGEIALRHFRSLASLPVEQKGHLDLVTEADRAVEDYLTASLQRAFPEDGIFGEERGEIAGSSGRIWVIDPIDGTFNFVRGGQNWAISIGLFENRTPIYGTLFAPVRDLMLSGGLDVPAQRNGKPVPPLPALDLSQGATGIGWHPSVSTSDRVELIRFVSDALGINVRFCGSSALSLVDIALGETDGYLALGDSTWDVMAGLPILASLGASHTIDWQRTGLDAKLRFACGSERFLAKVRPLLDKIAVPA